MFGSRIESALSEALRRRASFALALMPGETEPMLFLPDEENEAVNNATRFFINDFHKTFSPRISLGRCSEDEFVARIASAQSVTKAPNPWNQSTPHEEYLAALEELIATLKTTGGKTVISRAICLPAPAKGWVAVASELFAAFASTFRFVYHTPLTGNWMGATPETLLDFDRDAGVIRTMALAGTRPAGTPTAWDDKNVAENAHVVNYIADCLTSQGLNPTIYPAETVGYGAIEHLCHRIEAPFNGDLFNLIDALSPTPALAGRPLADALNHIAAIERHPRRCYGGYVGVETPERVRAFVNLRSLMFDGLGCCIYAGGGITADSQPEIEWHETSAKAERICNIITR